MMEKEKVYSKEKMVVMRPVILKPTTETQQSMAIYMVKLIPMLKTKEEKLLVKKKEK